MNEFVASGLPLFNSQAMSPPSSVRSAARRHPEATRQLEIEQGGTTGLDPVGPEMLLSLWRTHQTCSRCPSRFDCLDLQSPTWSSHPVRLRSVGVGQPSHGSELS